MMTQTEDRPASHYVIVFCMMAVAIYLVVFAIIFVDECLLKTEWLVRHTPPKVADVLRTCYRPLIKLFRLE